MLDVPDERLCVIAAFFVPQVHRCAGAGCRSEPGWVALQFPETTIRIAGAKSA
jgi:hypothetical protein